MIVSLLKPRFLSFLNRWFFRVKLRGSFSRELLFCAFSILLICGVYNGTQWLLFKIDEVRLLAYIPSSQPIGLTFVLLFFMILASCVAFSFGILFSSEDLDLLLSSPITDLELFSSRMLQTVISVAWMPFVFLLPLLLAFGIHYEASVEYYIWSVVALVPFVLIPAATAFIVCILFSLIIPKRFHKIAGAVAFCACLALVGWSIMILIDTAGPMRRSGDVLRLVSVLSLPNSPWLPSNWISIFLSGLLEPGRQPLNPYLIMLFSFAVALVSLAYMMFSLCHLSIYSSGSGISSKSRGRSVEQIFDLIYSWMSSELKAIARRDMKMVSRDISQIAQIVLIGAICLLYIYNLRLYAAFEAVSVIQKAWWRIFLFIMNSAVGAFVVTALCNRFVFPSVSLEGRSFWILLSSPVSVQSYVKAKFLFWYPIVAFLLALLFGASGYAILRTEMAIVVNVMGAISVSFAIVATALGLGCVFAQFDWESATQLIAGIGSFIFMLCSVLLIFLNMLPLWIALILATDKESLSLMSVGYMSFQIFVLLAVNGVIGLYSLKLGCRSLEKAKETNVM